MKCDIIIPIWNQLEFTRECIESIIKNTRYPYRLILVDNASDNDTRHYLESVRDRNPLKTALIRNDENLGFIKAVNQGLELSDGPFVCVLNNDTIPAPGWLERMVDFADSHPDVGLVNPQCDGHLDKSIEDYAEILEGNKGQYMEMNQCQGFAMLIKREVIDKIGILDESFGIGGFDDTDYSMRAHLAGYKCAAIRDAYVYHRLHGSFNKAGNRDEWVKRNEKIYYDKWGKHLRVGIAVCPNTADAEVLSNAIRLAYGLAREWTWVHLWVDFLGDKRLIGDSISAIIKRDNLPPHQNIRIDYFNASKGLLDLAISAKILERLTPRKRSKKFDSIIRFGEDILGFGFYLAKILNIKTVTFTEPNSVYDWPKEGEALTFLLNPSRPRRSHLRGGTCEVRPARSA